MRLADPTAFAAEVAGTTVGDRLEVNAWRGGVLLAQNLDVNAWALRWDASRQVQGQASVTIADPTGELAPWSLGDPLGPGGSRLQITWVSGLTGTVVPLGWWRIRRVQPVERWRIMDAAEVLRARRTNLLRNPRMVAGLAVWFIQPGTTEVAPGAYQTAGAGTGLPAGVSTYYRKTVTTAKTGGTGGLYTRDNASAIPGKIGDQIAASVYVRPSVAASMYLGAYHRKSGATVGTTRFSATIACPANKWTRLSVQFTADAVYDDVQLFATELATSIVPVGGTVDVGAAMVEVAPALGAWFDGSTADAPPRDYGWSGAANASRSTETIASTTYRAVNVFGGGSVSVDADEETASVVLDRLDAEVVTRSTCFAEVTRLLEDIMPVNVVTTLADGAVPAGLVYGESRMDAVEDLLAAMYAAYRLGPDGALEIVPAAGVGPVWTVEGGADGVLVSLVRALSDSGVYNAAISSGETATGQPLIGRAYLDSGTLAWSGPYGRVPIFHQAVAQTAAGVQADARTVLSTLSSAGEVDLDVVCLTHPGIQLHDRVTLIASTTAGGAPMVGRVVAMSMSGASDGDGLTPAKSMSLTVRVAAETLEAIGGRIARER